MYNNAGNLDDPHVRNFRRELRSDKPTDACAQFRVDIRVSSYRDDLFLAADRKRPARDQHTGLAKTTWSKCSAVPKLRIRTEPYV